MMRYWSIFAFIISHIIGGLLILLAASVLYLNLIKIKNLDPYKLIVLCLFFSIVITIHGISHVKMNKMLRKIMVPDVDDFIGCYKT